MMMAGQAEKVAYIPSVVGFEQLVVVANALDEHHADIAVLAHLV